jgi:hypothetical protein
MPPDEPSPPPLPPHELHYAPGPPKHHRWLWRISTLCGCIALALVLYSWSPLAVRHFRLIYWQKKCLQATASAGQIVFQFNDPSAKTSTQFVLPEWNLFLSAFSPIFRASTDGTIFLHRLKRPDGTERLVGVDLRMIHATDTLWFDADPSVFSTGGMFSSPAYAKMNSPTLLMDVRDYPTFRIYAGQLDPTDDSHFTFTLEADHKKYTFDGYLKSDDSILIERRPDATQ